MHSNDYNRIRINLPMFFDSKRFMKENKKCEIFLNLMKPTNNIESNSKFKRINTG